MVAWASHSAAASQAAASAASPSLGEALRTCNATLAGFVSTVTPARPRAISSSVSVMLRNSSWLMSCENPESNSAP